MTRRWIVAPLLLVLFLAGCTGSGESSGPSGTSTSTTSHLPAGEQRVRISVDGHERTALVVRPSSGAHLRPLVVFLHGSRSSAGEVQQQLGLDSQAKAAGVVVAYPDSNTPTGSWRAGCCGTMAADPSDLDFIAQLIRTLVAGKEVQAGRVALGGFSAGALLVNSFACRFPTLVAGIVSAAGSLLTPPSFVVAKPGAPRCTPPAAVTVLAVAGASDTTIPLAGSTAGCSAPCLPGTVRYQAPAATVSGWWRRIDGCGATRTRRLAVSVVIAASCRSGTTVGFAEVTGVAHDLPGLASRFPLRRTLIALASGTPLTAW